MVARVFTSSVYNRAFSGRFLNEKVKRTLTAFGNDKLKDMLVNLPRERRPAAVTRQKLRRAIADDEFKEKSSRVFLQILGNGRNGSPRALHLYTARKRYLFNCGEGTQRVANERKINLARWDNIFITRKSWENIGGLLGLALTIQMIGVNKLTIHGPPGTENLFNAAQNFIAFRTLQVEKVDSGYYEDDTIRVKSVPLINSSDKFSDDLSIAYICTLKYDEEISDSFIVVECPSHSHIDSLYGINKFISSALVTTIVHFSPSNVIDDRRYQKWINSFNCQHVVINDRCPGLRLNAASQLQEKLNKLSDDLFPPLPLQSDEPTISSLPSVLHAEPLCTIMLRPEFLLQRFNLSDDVTTVKNKSDVSPSSVEFPFVVFLGTVSGLPSLTRNSSSILLHCSESNCVLLDCGEGTYAQLSSFFGAAKTAEILRKLNVIFLSHHHADHHLGLINILQERYKLAPNCDRVNLLASTPLDSWLESYDRFVEPIKHLYNFVPNENISADLLFYPNRDGVEFLPIKVTHCQSAYGLVVNVNGQWKLVYSGDTRPSRTLIDAGLECDLLIHEATMEDTFSTEAELMKHSTISEALEVGTRMKAKFTILTHFNTRYARFPFMSLQENKYVGCAFDFMKVSSSTLPQLMKLTLKLKIMFTKEYEEYLLNRQKRRYWKLDRNKKFK